MTIINAKVHTNLFQAWVKLTEQGITHVPLWEIIQTNDVDHLKELIGNYKKLADYLLALPDDYKHFNMYAYWADTNRKDKEDLSLRELINNIDDQLHTCGTAGCVLGHAVVSQLFDMGEDTDLNCWGYVEDQVFGKAKDSNSWELYDGRWKWLFTSDWSTVDNTPVGAAHRLLYAYYFGIPAIRSIHKTPKGYPFRMLLPEAFVY